MALAEAETSELVDRYKALILDYQKLTVELASHLERYGKVRKELQILIDEFGKRKLNVEEIDVSVNQ